jgi:CheY-like chemotaxis protein
VLGQLRRSLRGLKRPSHRNVLRSIAFYAGGATILRFGGYVTLRFLQHSSPRHFVLLTIAERDRMMVSLAEVQMADEAKPVVLVADDDPEIRSLLAIRLKKAGYEVLEAADGEQTIAQVKEHSPVLIVLDVMMPGKNGWEVAKEIRHDDEMKDVGIVMLTAIGERINEMTSPLYGADEYLDKPFEFADLEATIRKVIERRSQPDGGE